MKISAILSTVSIGLLLGGAPCKAEPVWASGSSLFEVIGFDLKSHDANQKLDDYQTNAVCLLLGYLTGFVESAALAAHYNATALPFFLPDTITNDQIERIVYKYLSDNPDKLNLKGGTLVVAALTREFPNPVFKPPLNPPQEEQSPSPLRKPTDNLSKSLLRSE